ncbi:uncharacterized protein B0H18DRAFT_1108583 [Fomitopsis serialis]|uniref:uncharacterized protein n=1 Tax=Fomitopsis serialis TaxID=139415 RepID=UPI0020079443|nr:uncharacterized protein B0H18DRAFT_1108583 [Neoantrodia serialis]KAH9913734.1 hypothetical protein B0H18DRAFT_1108583 [Neoantrodia serialis]
MSVLDSTGLNTHFQWDQNTWDARHCQYRSRFPSKVKAPGIALITEIRPFGAVDRVDAIFRRRHHQGTLPPRHLPKRAHCCLPPHHACSSPPTASSTFPINLHYLTVAFDTGLFYSIVTTQHDCCTAALRLFVVHYYTKLTRWQDGANTLQRLVSTDRTVVTLQGIRQERRETEERRATLTAGLSGADNRALAEIRGEELPPDESGADVDMNLMAGVGAEAEDDWEDEYKGGDTFLHALRDISGSSVEVFTKLLCRYYQVPFQRRIHIKIADVFEIYLTIMREVDKRVQAAVGRDSPNWCVLYGCPPCGYKLDNEPNMRWSRMLCVDGNNSLKRLAALSTRKVGDARVFHNSNYYIPDAFVNRFTGKIRPQQPQPEANGADEEGDPTDGVTDVSLCTTNWKAAAADNKKKSWAMFDETGIFTTACRHGFVLWLIDMVRSGELAKYPLAMTAKILEVFKEKILCGYDIGCTFEGTVRRSSLGVVVRVAKNHPNVIPKMGIEDLETLERVFSASNNLAPITRYASAYRRRLFIEEFFRQWDKGKYTNLSTMLYNNYKQALDIIDTDTIGLDETKRVFHFSAKDMEKWYEEERQFFLTSCSKTSELSRARQQGPPLISLAAVPADYNSSGSNGSGTQAYYAVAAETCRLESERHLVRERHDLIHHEVIAMEVKLGISRQWQAGDALYDSTMKYIVERKYRQALESLQRLVIQWLFELHKLNPGTAYRVRTHIAKSLQTHCKAIRNAVAKYNLNSAASALNPPRPTLNWSRVSHYSFLEEFELLQDTRNNICAKPWTEPAVREAMKQARRITHAEEELQCCHVKARRLHTFEPTDEIWPSEMVRPAPAGGVWVNVADIVIASTLPVVRPECMPAGSASSPTLRPALPSLNTVPNDAPGLFSWYVATLRPECMPAPPPSSMLRPACFHRTLQRSGRTTPRLPPPLLNDPPGLFHPTLQCSGRRVCRPVIPRSQRCGRSRQNSKWPGSPRCKQSGRSIDIALQTSWPASGPTTTNGPAGLFAGRKHNVSGRGYSQNSAKAARHFAGRAFASPTRAEKLTIFSGRRFEYCLGPKSWAFSRAEDLAEAR